MIKESITIQDALDVLNRALKSDPEAIRQLCVNRTKCNKELSNDPTIQAHKALDNEWQVGLTGILNGLFGIEEKSGWGAIASRSEVECDKCGYSADDFKWGNKCPKCGGVGIEGRYIEFFRTPQSLPGKSA